MKSSVDRTNSPRKRAGSRRNKKLRNVRMFASDEKNRPTPDYGHYVIYDEWNHS